MDPTEEHADFAAYSASPALPPSFAAGAPIQDSSLASAPVGSDPLVAGIVARLAATAGAGTRPSLSEAHLNSSSGLFSLPGAVPCTVKALSSPGLLAALDEPISPLQAHCPMAVAPHASLECTAESNLARSLTSSRSRRARENPQMQPHEEFKKLPEAREGEHEREVKSRAVRGGNGERLGGVRVAGGRGIGNIEKREGGLVGEGGRARGMSIEQLEAEAGRTDARTDGLKRNSWLSGSRSRKRGNPMKQQRLLPSEDEVREAATDWPTLGTTLRRVLRMGGSGVDDRGGLGTGAAGAGAEPTGEAAAGAARSHGWSFCEGMEGAEGATCLAVDEEGLVQQGQEEQPKAALHLPAHPQAEQKQQQQEEEERHRQQELQWQQQEEQQQQQRIPLPPASKMPSIGGLWKPGRLGGDPRVMDYECRFCGKGFDSPRALGGHMNLHRKGSTGSRVSAVTSLGLPAAIGAPAAMGQGPSTHSNRSPPHHLLLPPLASDPFLSTLCPEVLQSLFLRSCPSETSPADAVTPRAVITASSFAPAHPASVPPSLPPLPAAAPPPITIPRSEPFPAVPYLTSGPLSSPLVTPSLIRPPVLAGSAVSTPAAAAPLTTPHAPAVLPSLQPPIFLHQPNLAQQQQQQILTSRPVVSQQREASALTRRPLQGEGAGGSEEDELAQLEQLRQLLLLQEQLIRDQPGGEGLELKRQGLEGMKGVECCGDLNQQVETEGGIAGQEKLCCSEE
ncbi:unnamed protein product [Closterium sp. NIES-64]|nr:unnamed protein product [Closterium sp. NIES-64]